MTAANRGAETSQAVLGLGGRDSDDGLVMSAMTVREQRGGVCARAFHLRLGNLFLTFSSLAMPCALEAGRAGMVPVGGLED